MGKLTPQEIKRRRKNTQEALAAFRLEGIAVSEETLKEAEHFDTHPAITPEEAITKLISTLEKKSD